MREFAGAGACWAGTSWGKDSTVIAHMVHRLQLEGYKIPVVWFRATPNLNPDCLLVRDVFLDRLPLRDYSEITCEISLVEKAGVMEWGNDEGYNPVWDAYHREVCPRHILGLRAQESSVRSMRMRRWGAEPFLLLAPIGRFSAADVFAYLHKYDLPVHPAYAATMAGRWERGRLRVAALGGAIGRGHGREAWEEHYYGEEMREARSAAEVSS